MHQTLKSFCPAIFYLNKKSSLFEAAFLYINYNFFLNDARTTNPRNRGGSGDYIRKKFILMSSGIYSEISSSKSKSLGKRISQKT